jgi:phosphoribosyl 1,2-cyclic phosphodiesterase
MQLRFWGVRGSTPTPQVENMRYGGNTSCVEVRIQDRLFVFDCGTGFRMLGQHLTRQAGGQPLFAHIFVSHYHWDHIQGIPFFRPLYDSPNNVFVFHSSKRNHSLKQVMEEQMTAPYFPVNMNEMQANRAFHAIEEGRVALDDDVTIQAAWLNHPQGCLGFRIESKGCVLVYATDNEPGDPQFDKNVRKLAEGADILIYDTQYLPEEYEAHKRGWGHSHWREGVNIVMESGAKQLILFHHDPEHTDVCLDNVVKEARNYYPQVRAAAEGMQVEIKRS